MKFTFLGHACFTIESNGTTLLFDPFISGNPKASGINIADVKCDYILITHGHGDHIADAVAIAQANDATCVSSFEIIQWLGNQGVDKGHPMNLGGKWKFDFGTVKMVNASHSSSFPDGAYAGPASGFILEWDDKTLYFAGDTALMADMKRWGEHFDFDHVILPVGDNFTMGFEDAALAAKWLKSQQAIGVHFDTFSYIEIDHAAAVDAFAANGVHLTLPEIGQVIEL
ncbi:UNVERIFIED_CONTAM: hypothetical protein GTU68_037719 [Idotea baltica]|nr:hypothetical protein [Idotea baltica]